LLTQQNTQTNKQTQTNKPAKILAVAVCTTRCVSRTTLVCWHTDTLKTTPAFAIAPDYDNTLTMFMVAYSVHYIIFARVVMNVEQR